MTNQLTLIYRISQLIWDSWQPYREVTDFKPAAGLASPGLHKTPVKQARFLRLSRILQRSHHICIRASCSSQTGSTSAISLPCPAQHITKSVLIRALNALLHWTGAVEAQSAGDWLQASGLSSTFGKKLF